MKKNISILNRLACMVCFLWVPILLGGCDSDGLIKEAVEEVDEVNEPVGEELSAEELDYVTQLLQAEEAMNEIWRDFDSFRSSPIFVVTGEEEGFYINPPDTQIAVNRPITYEIDGLNSIPLYRNDLVRTYVQQNISSLLGYGFPNYAGNDMFAFDTTHDIGDYFYAQYKDRDGFYDVSVFYHELFHLYQSENADGYFGDEEYVQSLNRYPLTTETFPYILLLFDVMIDAHLAQTPEDQTRLLEYYVAIQYHLESIDPTEDDLIRNHGFFLEKLEGAPRYVEVFGTFYSLNNDTVEDPTHGFSQYAAEITARTEVRLLYARRMFYHTGAGAIHLMNSLGFEGLDDAFLVPSNTPYDIARDFLQMTDAEREAALESAKVDYPWQAYLERSEYLLSL
ncbi:MAG: hypothetical protein Aureis2KO_30830 [Aureisphaera sp.]